MPPSTFSFRVPNRVLGLFLVAAFCVALVGCYRPPPKDDFGDLLQKAEIGYSNAQAKVAFIYMTGRGGVPKNRIQAMRWYRAAALQGNSDANAALTSLGKPLGGVGAPRPTAGDFGGELKSDEELFGSYYALVIGNAAYQELEPLETTVNDAVAVAEILETQYGFTVNTLIDANWEQMRTEMARYRRSLGPRDNLLIYYAGHGWVDEETSEAYWLPVDANADIETYWISNATIATTLKGIRAKHVMVVADSCFSGTLVRGVKLIREKSSPSFIQKLSSRRSRTAMTSGGIEPVVDTGENGHSVFANAFLRSLEMNEGVLDGTSLYSQVRQGVMVNADQTPSYGSIRSSGHEDGDFLFVRLERDDAQ